MTSGARLPTWKERENNKKRERRRRAIASKIFAGLRQYGNYKLPKHCDNNEVLKALCSEAGWVVEDDGTTYRKGAKPLERMEVCASAPASPSPTSSYHNGNTNNNINNGGNTPIVNPTAAGSEQGSGASLIPWLKGLSGTSTPTSCFQCNNSAPVTPPISSPRKTDAATAAAAAAAAQTKWDRISMAENWVNGGGTWSPVIVGPAITNGTHHGNLGSNSAVRVRPCETPDGCLTPCSDVGDSEPNVTEILNRYSGNKSGRWINGTRVITNNSGNNVTAAAVNFVASSGTATPIHGARMASPSMANNLGHHFAVDNNNNSGNVTPGYPGYNTPGGYQHSWQQQQQQHIRHNQQNHHQQQQQQQQQQHNQHHQQQQHYVNPAVVNPPPHPHRMNIDEQHQQQCSPSSSSVCGVVVQNAKRKRHELVDLEMSSVVTRLEIDGGVKQQVNGGVKQQVNGGVKQQVNGVVKAPPPGGEGEWTFSREPTRITTPRNINLNDRLQLTLATPASSS